MKRGEIIKNAYALWAEGIGNNWESSSPYICDNIRYAVEEGTSEDKDRADGICKLIESTVGRSVQTHLEISQEFYDFDEIKRSRDPLAMAFRLGMWQALAKRYEVGL